MSRHPECKCGHPYEDHKHLRPGTDCSVPGCGCMRYRPKHGLLIKFPGRRPH